MERSSTALWTKYLDVSPCLTLHWWKEAPRPLGQSILMSVCLSMSYLALMESSSTALWTKYLNVSPCLMYWWKEAPRPLGQSILMLVHWWKEMPRPLGQTILMSVCLSMSYLALMKRSATPLQTGNNLTSIISTTTPGHIHTPESKYFFFDFSTFSSAASV